MDKGNSIKTWGYIADITIMFLNIVQKGQSLIYNTTGKNFVSIYQLARIISKNFKNKKVIIKKKKIANSFIGSDYLKIQLSSKKYFSEFKVFKSRNFESGVKRLIEWNINKIK